MYIWLGQKELEILLERIENIIKFNRDKKAKKDIDLKISLPMRYNIEKKANADIVIRSKFPRKKEKLKHEKLLKAIKLINIKIEEESKKQNIELENKALYKIYETNTYKIIIPNQERDIPNDEIKRDLKRDEIKEIKVKKNNDIVELIQILKEIYKNEKIIIKQVMFFDETKNKLYKLVSTYDWPTIEISGIHMHRIKSVTPKQDTLMKIKEISPIKGVVLDTCFGLGYTALLASKRAIKVISFEIDENVLKIAKLNPISRKLFFNKKVKLVLGDAHENIKKLRSNSVDRIIHDPPSFPLSPKLYSKEFIYQLYRVLKKYGKLYFYTGNKGKISKGIDIGKNIMRWLKELGFEKVYRNRALGITAIK